MAKMNGAQMMVKALEDEGVSTLFGIPGGTVIHLYDALYDSKLNHILMRHEQAAAHAADGYARATGEVGVALVTSGPGATNTVTGIATAYMDSVPIVVITGQVPRGVIGTDSFQESDIVGITMPIVKHSYLLQSADELPRTFREAFHIARTGRPGPVLIDIPSDVASEKTAFGYPVEVCIPSYKPTYKGNARQVKAAAARIAQAERPVVYAGGGVISSGASAEVAALAELMRIPIVTTLMGKGGVPASYPLNLGQVGMHGSKFANLALTESDLIIACGARFSDRVTGRLDEFAPHADVIHIDIDPAEIGKVREVQIPIVGDLKGVLASKPMSYTQITGIFVPFTAEANVNTNNVAVDLPFVMAHETAHRYAVAPEDEANFYAFYILEDAEDPLLAYSAALAALRCCQNALYVVDYEAFAEIYGTYSELVVGDLKAYAEHWRHYEGGVSEVSEAVNNLYLQVQGIEDGDKSYGRMVDLMLAWYDAKVLGR